MIRSVVGCIGLLMVGYISMMSMAQETRLAVLIPV